MSQIVFCALEHHNQLLQHLFHLLGHDVQGAEGFIIK